MKADNRDRTGGLRITSASLYLLSHIGKLYYIIKYIALCQIEFPITFKIYIFYFSNKLYKI